MLEALLATIIRPCLGQGSNKTPPLLKDDANELFGTLRAEEILAINTAFREQLRVSLCTVELVTIYPYISCRCIHDDVVKFVEGKFP